MIFQKTTHVLQATKLIMWVKSLMKAVKKLVNVKKREKLHAIQCMGLNFFENNIFLI